MTKTIEQRAAEWAAGRNTGVSSKCIMGFFLGAEFERGYPHDHNDLGRCLDLLAAVPEWEERLLEMKQIGGIDGAVWAALAPRWSELKTKYAEGYEPCTALMREIIHPLEDSSGQVVRLGKNVSIRFPEKHGDKPQSDSLMEKEQARVDEEKAAKPELPGLGHNIGGVSGQRLLSFIERIERLEEEKASLAEDVKEVYAEAKGVGFDTKTMRRIVMLKKMDPDKRREEEELVDLYKRAIGIS